MKRTPLAMLEGIAQLLNRLCYSFSLKITTCESYAEQA